MFRKNRLTRFACCSTEPQLSVSDGLRCHFGILFRRWQSLQKFTLNLPDYYWFCSVGKTGFYDGNYLLNSSVLGWEKKCQSALIQHCFSYPTVALFHLKLKTNITTASRMIDYLRFNCMALSPNKNRTFTETEGCSHLSKFSRPHVEDLVSCYISYFSPQKNPHYVFFATVMRQVSQL